MPIRGLQHIDIAASDVETSIAFYLALLGQLGVVERFRMRTYRGTEDVVYLEIGGQGFGLRAADAGEYRHYHPGIEHIAFEVDRHGEVDEAYERCVALGARIESPPEQHYVSDGEDYYAFFAFDPDGIRIEVFAWLTSPYRAHGHLEGAAR